MPIIEGQNSSNTAGKGVSPSPMLTQARRILVMEDDSDLCDIYSRSLRRAGYQVYQAMTISEARDLLAKHRFDIFVCDMHMGTERSFGLLQEQRASLVSNGTATVVISAEEQYRGRCEEIGIEFFLSKPVDIKHMVTLLSRLPAAVAAVG
jgi:DNA-binding response OmpR family regulator